MADGSKPGRITLARIADITGVREVITDDSADPAHLAAIRNAGVEVTIADG